MRDHQGSLPGAGETLAESLRGRAWVPLTRIAEGGFDSLEVVVRGTAGGADADGVPVPDTADALSVIEFAGNTGISMARSLTLDATVLRAANPGSVRLTAPYVALGSSDPSVRMEGSVPDVLLNNRGIAVNNSASLRLTPTAGDASLSVQAEHIDLRGELVTQGIGSATNPSAGLRLQASGDIRAVGVRSTRETDYAGLLRSTGTLGLQAARIYPSTLSDYRLELDGANSAILIGASGVAPEPRPPLSLGGRLALSGTRIEQGGRLYAPLGELSLTAGERLALLAGSFTSTSALGVSAPFFRTQPGGDLLVPAVDGNGVNLVFTDRIDNPSYEIQLPQQALSLKAPDIDIQANARLDLRGGSSSKAVEFVPGPGGSRDLLLADLDPGSGVSANPSFAILPGVGEFAPHDPLETPAAAAAQGLRPGNTWILAEGVAGLPAGEYAMLPARYALFGGYLVTPIPGTTDLPVGRAAVGADGVPIVAGRYAVAGSAAQDSRVQGFSILSGAQVRSRAEYLETPLQDLYAGRALRSTRDAGTLVIEADRRLQLAGTLVAGGPLDGRGPSVDIVADQISLVTQAGAGSGVELLSGQLQSLGADSLLIGGRRGFAVDGLNVTPRSSRLSVAPGVELALPELILVADRLDLQSGLEATTLRSTRFGAAAEQQLRIGARAGDPASGDAALVAVSGNRLRPRRDAPGGGNSSSLSVGANVRLAANGSIVADAAGDVYFKGTIDTNGGRVGLGASSVSLGQVDDAAAVDGLLIDNALLAELAGSQLALRSDSTIRVHGDLRDPATGIRPYFERLLLDAQGLVGVDNEGLQVQLGADELVLANSTEVGLASTTAGAGRIALDSKRLLLGDGPFAVQGFSDVALHAAEYTMLNGDGALRADGSLTLDTPFIAASQGARMRIAAPAAHLRLSGGVAGAPIVAAPVASGLAARLQLQGASVDYDAVAHLPSGRFEIVGNGEVAIGGAARIDVSGSNQDFGPLTTGTAGGDILIRSGNGGVSVAAGALLDVSPSAISGEAGWLQLQAPAGELRIDVATRLLSGARGGAFQSDSKTLTVAGNDGASAYSDLNRLLGAGQFEAKRDVRLRNQDVELTADSTVRAHEIRISADGGDVRLAGTLDASGRAAGGIHADGGSIVVAAADTLHVETGAMLRARGAADEWGEPAAGTHGGVVELLALDADQSDPAGLNDRVELASGALIDVSGGPAAAAAPGSRLVQALEQRGGEVRVITRRIDTNGDDLSDTVVLGAMDAEIQGAAGTRLIATRVARPGERIGALAYAADADLDADGVLDDIEITTADIAALHAETAAFMQSARPSPDGFALWPGLLLQSEGDLVLRDDWDFQPDWHFGRTVNDPGSAGLLMLRAAGDVNLKASLSDAFFDETPVGFPVYRDRLAGASIGADGNEVPPPAWSFRLTGGADPGSADPSATVSGPGAVRLLRDADGIEAFFGQAAASVKADALALYNPLAPFFWAFQVNAQGLADPTFDAPSPEAVALGVTNLDLDLEPADLAAAGFVTTQTLPVRLRTGTGDIQVAAAGDVVLGTGRLSDGDGNVLAASSAIYTGGYDLGLSENIRQVLPPQGLIDTAKFSFNRWLGGGAQFTVDGGDVSVRAGGDVIVDGHQGSPSEWQPRIGEAQSGTSGLARDGGAVPTHWGIAFHRFSNGIGALGGGTLQVKAGGDLVNLALAVPTTGRAVAGAVRDPRQPGKFAPALETTEVGGGGRLQVEAGGDLRGGSLYLGSGFAEVRVDGAVSAGSSGQSTLIYNGGEGRFTLDAGAQVLIGGITDPGMVGLSQTQGDYDASLTNPNQSIAANAPGYFDNSFYTYGVAASTSIGSLGGDVRLDGEGFVNAVAPRLRVVSHGGDIVNAVSINQYPSPDGQLELLAAGNLGGAVTTLWQRDQDPKLLPSIDRPAASAVPLHDRVPVHADDDEPNLLIARTGSIEALGNGPWRFDLAKSSIFQAGLDLSNLSVAVQNVRASDISAFVAGRDIVQQTRRDNDGNFQVTRNEALVTRYEIAGPGAAQFVAGRHISLGTSDGIESIGDGRNAALPNSGAHLRLLAGIGSSPDYLGYVGPLLQAPGEMGDRSRQLLGRFLGGTSDAPLADFANLPERAQRDIASVLLVEQLQRVGVAATQQGEAGSTAQLAGYQPGFDAIQTLFPDNDASGGISMLLSQVQTLDGGDVLMLVPGGSINAGAANSDIIDKSAADLGIVAAVDGNIGIFVDGDFLVNSTRAFALQGDLLVWSSNGAIDAGKGAKTVSSIPDPIARIGPQGETIIEFPPAVEGSGLQGVNAYLFAPRGVINAGDAGIRTSGNLTLGSPRVIGADNIDVGGVSVGVPTASVAPPPAVPAQDNVATRATREVTEQSTTAAEGRSGGQRGLSVISVEVLGFGES
ncbi:MAG: filamentous hemagglutinin family protein [Gammaproteobacteria bacterium]|nr:filamentous hemagglutinin family protein [Gammaproteobacteria bacterium]